MQANIAILFALAASVLPACNVEQEQTKAEGPLMPLAIGNEWRYEVTHEDGNKSGYTVEVSGMSEVLGDLYYSLVITYDSGLVDKRNYVRSAEGGITFLYYIEETGDKESNWFKSPAEEGEQYQYTDVRGKVLAYRVEEHWVHTQVGRLMAYAYAGYDADPQAKIFFTPGIGVVRLEDSSTKTVLVSYHIAE